nr:ADP-ribosylation factor GTPase-activating protein AGD3 [Tanacetum cinerariifolium]
YPGSNGLDREDNRGYCFVAEFPDVLRRVCGNDKCADCGASDPDWACLNLGILVCIECSGVHRNLGVHISKVRSLTLDVKVWEPSVITLFQSLGNAFANSVWEELLYKPDKPQLPYFCKPRHSDSIPVKEKFINAKYVSKVFVRKPKDHNSLVAQHIWEAVGANDKKSVYRLISSSAVAGTSEGHGYGTEEFDGCTLLHLACETADVGMIELLLQYGANINVFSSRGQTPLHHCILRGKAACAKLLLTRGADPQAANGAVLVTSSKLLNIDNMCIIFIFKFKLKLKLVLLISYFCLCFVQCDGEPISPLVSNLLLSILLDSGLAKLNVNANVLHTSFDRNGASSRSYYYAPECFPNFSIYTEKSDIFSFGVILGILLTGRDPSDAIFRGSGSGSGSNSRSDMGMWFRQIVEAGDGRDALDKSLLGEEMEEDEMLMAVRIAAVCLSDMPADRPSSDELVPMLTQLHSF